MARILLAIDGDFQFSAASLSHDFNFTVLTQTFANAGHQVTKVHRGTDPSADVQNFTFDGALNLLDFDILWMIGRAGRNAPPGSTVSSATGISDSEVRAIARFMAAGGGVFATGDHDSIGVEMCGRIP